MDDRILALCAPVPLPTTPATRLAELVFPSQTNHHGTLFGGAALALMDRAAYIAATRLARGMVVTAAVEAADFRRPVLPGQLAEVTAKIVKIGSTSLTIDIELIAEDLLSGGREYAVGGRFVMVAPEERFAPAMGAGPQAAPEAGTSFVEVIFPDIANHREILFGGNALSMMGKAAFIAATRHCRETVVMAASERIDFLAPIKVGEFADLEARVVMTGRSSICVEVDLTVENPLSGDRERSARGRFVMVAVGRDGKPVRVPPRMAPGS
ncbi:acyl-CoA thioesterase [Parvibaculum sedimenti]|uniref:Acyl-CoA thioesterase n=1 Tax=Parvibaculum sedimenti TaxID=2608632 RepID=A0A6N6VFM1_9HYPH|nr:acyl-CoA thioesterase [Parvibaculum sedimenti]KAB7738674.1 acyl-CoA thioesterase [Parvibaculum sedimenti]